MARVEGRCRRGGGIGWEGEAAVLAESRSSSHTPWFSFACLGPHLLVAAPRRHLRSAAAAAAHGGCTGRGSKRACAPAMMRRRMLPAPRSQGKCS